MYSKVIVPLDGSELSERSLPFARIIAGALPAPIELIEAFDILPPAVHAHQLTLATQSMLEEAKVQSDHYLSGVRASLRDAGCIATAITLPGAPAQAIADRVRDDPTALVIMSTHGRGGLARWALGSVADRMLHSIPNPVLLIRSAAASNWPQEWQPDAVLVPIDGSELSELSLEHAASIATALKRRIILLQVRPDTSIYRRFLRPPAASTPGETGPSAAELLAEADAADSRTWLDRAARRLTHQYAFANGVEESILESDNVSDTIIAQAGEQRAMVVMTTHGRSGLDRMVLGSVADRVVRHANVPVLVVRRNDPQGAGLGQPIPVGGA